MEEKMKKIKAWLDGGYTVKLFGNYGTYGDRIVKSADGNYYHYSRFGSSAVRATEDGLNFVLTKIFNPEDDFYIIHQGNVDSDGNFVDSYMECTDNGKAFYCNHAFNKFLFYEDPDFIYAGQETIKPYTVETTITDIILHHYDYGKYINTRKGGCHFKVQRHYTGICGEFKNFTFAL